jgi:tetratricopeptide (TPR) repeat protein
LGALFFVVWSAGAVQAQLTTQSLIGDSVSEIGNRYTDVDEAIKRFLNHDVLAARQFLESAKKKDPSLPPIELLMAKMYYLTNNANAGRVALEKTAQDNPEDPEPYLILAGQAMQQGQIIAAEALYEKGLALALKYSGNAKRKRNFEISGRSGRALVAQRRKNWDAAVAELKTLLQLDPDNANFHLRLGTCLFMLKQYQAGFDEFSAAKKADKASPEPLVAAASMYEQLKISDKAQQAYERALAANKADPGTIAAYAQWLIRSGNQESIVKAEGMLAEARKTNPDDLNLLILSGVAARMLKKLNPAEDYFVAAHGIAPGNSEVMNQLALLQIEQADQAKRNRARQFATMSAQINNQNADAQITLGWVLYQLGLNAEAEQFLRSGMQGSPSPDSSYLIAKVFAEQNKPDFAKQLLKAALENESGGIFIYRKDAQALLDSLK